MIAWCIVLNHENIPTSELYPVSIEHESAVHVLRERIKDASPAIFKDIDASQLVIWRCKGRDSIPQEALGERIPTLFSEGGVEALNLRVSIESLGLREDETLFVKQRDSPAHTYKRKREQDDGEIAAEDELEHELGAGRYIPLKKTDDAINEARAYLRSKSTALKVAATTDIQPDASNPFFVDGLGALYHKDQAVKGRVDDLFGRQDFRVVFNTSGSGKTRLLAEGLCQHWGFYFTPDFVPRLGSKDLHLALDRIETSPHPGLTFTSVLPKSPKRRTEALSHNRLIARIAFHSIILARLLVFEAFLQAGAGMEAADLRRRWTYLQLVPGGLQFQSPDSDTNDIFIRVYQIVREHLGSDEGPVNSLLEKIYKDSRILCTSLYIILDEAQLLADMYSLAFHSNDPLESAGSRSLLREIYSSWGCSLTKTKVIFSGTGFSITKVLNSVASSVGASTNINVDSIFTDLGAFVNQEVQRAYIEENVTLDESTKDEVLRRAWQWLRGRHRFTGGFVYLLKQSGTSDALLHLNNYIYTLSGYSPAEPSDSDATYEPKFLSIAEDVKKLDEDAHLRGYVASVIATFMLKNTPQLLKPSDTKMVELGIARYQTSSEGNHKAIILDEPLVIAALLKYLENTPDSMEVALVKKLSSIPKGPLRGYSMEDIGMYVIARQLDGTRSLGSIFDFKTDLSGIANGKAQLIAIDGINSEGTSRYSIVSKPCLYPFGMGLDVRDPPEHLKWFQGTGVPFCLPDNMSGHDLGFFVLVDGRVVFVMVQFKSCKKNLDKATTEQALVTISPAGLYMNKNEEVYGPGAEPRQKILAILQGTNTTCVGVLAFPSKPHAQVTEDRAPQHFALFDFEKVEGELGKLIEAFKADQFASL